MEVDPHSIKTVFFVFFNGVFPYLEHQKINILVYFLRIDIFRDSFRNWRQCNVITWIFFVLYEWLLALNEGFTKV